VVSGQISVVYAVLVVVLLSGLNLIARALPGGG
jgi:hypothetical protein